MNPITNPIGPIGSPKRSPTKTGSPTKTAATAEPLPGAPPAPRLADEDNNKRRNPGAPGTAVITKTKPQTKRPSLYRVLLLNDDYTPMEFVVHVLERFFNKDHETAHRILSLIHISEPTRRS